MWPSVKQAFSTFSEKFEGRVNHLYLDVRGLATIGIGNLIDDPQTVMVLPFKSKTSGQLVPRSFILREWQRVKANTALAQHGAKAFESITNLMLSGADIDYLVHRRVLDMENILELRPEFKRWEDWPACAQMAWLSLSWAAGPSASFPHLQADSVRGDWAQAALDCKMNEAGNPGLHPRNVANGVLFRNAWVISRRMPERIGDLVYPEELEGAK